MSRYVRKGVWGKPRSPICALCGQEKPRTKAFWNPDRRSPDGLNSGWCRACISKRLKQLAKEARVNAILHYSHGTPQCACCGDNRFEFLALDHIGGGGNKHRQTLTGSKRGAIYRALERAGYPAGFQVLCHNCNMAKHIYGTCPYATSHVWPSASRFKKVS